MKPKTMLLNGLDNLSEEQLNIILPKKRKQEQPEQTYTISEIRNSLEPLITNKNDLEFYLRNI